MPVFITKNGYGDMVIMNMQTYEEENMRIYKKKIISILLALAMVFSMTVTANAVSNLIIKQSISVSGNSGL